MPWSCCASESCDQPKRKSLNKIEDRVRHQGRRLEPANQDQSSLSPAASPARRGRGRKAGCAEGARPALGSSGQAVPKAKKFPPARHGVQGCSTRVTCCVTARRAASELRKEKNSASEPGHRLAKKGSAALGRSVCALAARHRRAKPRHLGPGGGNQTRHGW